MRLEALGISMIYNLCWGFRVGFILIFPCEQMSAKSKHEYEIWPEVVDAASEAKVRKRVATLLRVVAEVVRKYSWNLVAEPLAAAVAALVASWLVLEMAVLRADSCVPEQDTTSTRLPRAFGTEAAVSGSMVKVRVLLSNSYTPANTVESTGANSKVLVSDTEYSPPVRLSAWANKS